MKYTRRSNNSPKDTAMPCPYHKILRVGTRQCRVRSRLGTSKKLIIKVAIIQRFQPPNDRIDLY
ncbi:MAG: hypothetical protein HC894_06910 [Microcoleus sp. SM1_3_4]|nr:hypothetical protein [Microcoleus sp. SM1_3_4]